MRRTRSAQQPNAGLGDSNTVSRNIAPGLGAYYHINENEVLHTHIGRRFEDGSDSWVELGENPDPADTAAHDAGYTLGNQHPDFSTTGANAGDLVLTQEQLDCVVEFVNFGDSDPAYYFADFNTNNNPVEYTINAAASAVDGKIFNTNHAGHAMATPLLITMATTAENRPVVCSPSCAVTASTASLFIRRVGAFPTRQ